MKNNDNKNIKGYNFGLVISNFNKKTNYDANDATNINKLLLEHKLLILKNTQLNDDEFIEFARQFGNLEITYPVEYDKATIFL